ncbi:MAG: prolipoprotein diacylglyceryl transferase [Sedimentibacter saalensis]|uniref:Phosphatidylglycerol--prolipoprotein diacylglyceryl transferase n=1 Tax=Sedimentibacter saalensis TaxID=130788 RepID=A0A562J279_9FIRM|nr:prolipoprotein diacylglyceryl transferase [Sedimentibacter saalensis]MEA5096651.1 prolipoprotein diacylglyceryl transferase [Sedimentibacter saalensis]TWH76945.1 phosphatidylglycerol:prolipoprotein diacylglycerol transferase [Sedimentibacter saalensis]
MNPVAFTIFGVDIMWYGVLISTGVLLGVVFALKECKRIGFKEDNLLDFLLYAIPAAIIGARAYYVIFSWDFYSKNPDQIINIRNGGLAIHGALIAGVIVGVLFCKKRKIKVLELLDIVMPSVALGQAIGRWGNFINQEAHGGPTDLPWGIIVNGQKVHPTFLYESIIDLCIFLFLMWFRKNKKTTDGQVLGLYLIFYSAGRFFVEGLRTDSLMFLGMRVAQLISLGSILLGVILLVYLNKKKAQK